MVIISDFELFSLSITFWNYIRTYSKQGIGKTYDNIFSWHKFRMAFLKYCKSIVFWYFILQRRLNNLWNFGIYRKVSNIRRTLVGNKIVDHSDVVGASPIGAAPTTSSFST